MSDISPKEEIQLNAEVQAFKFGQTVRSLTDEKKKLERDLKVEEWTKYRDSLPKEVRRAIVIAYRTGYGEDEEE